MSVPVTGLVSWCFAASVREAKGSFRVCQKLELCRNHLSLLQCRKQNKLMLVPFVGSWF